jgi:N-acetylglucosaminyldiphosphoundecaprenol N-acetyl-beta-D-mannosaminyltransferase
VLKTLRAPCPRPISRSDLVQASPNASSDDLDRNVFGLLGIPVDAIGFPSLLQCMREAVRDGSPFLISTPNVNFLVKSQQNSEFRESMLLSDLCLVDGMPLVWIAKMLRIPIGERVAGSDLFDRLKSADRRFSRPLRVFLLGGSEGAAAKVGAKLNAENCGLECVGVLNPGFGTIEEQSTPEIIDAINASNADLIAVFFSAEKAQAWLMYNHWRLQPPLRAQFGATINFEAGTVKRAPPLFRSTGFEWLWRIKEEPYLWHRYFSDGRTLLKLLAVSVLPLMAKEIVWRGTSELSITTREETDCVIVGLSGTAVALHIDSAIACLRRCLATGKPIVLDVTNLRHIDARFIGLLLIVRKQLSRRGQTLQFAGVSARVRRALWLRRFDYLLS